MPTAERWGSVGLQSMKQGTFQKMADSLSFGRIRAVHEILQGWTELESVRTWGRCACCKRFLESNPSLPFPCPQVCLLLPPPCSSLLLLPRARHNTDVVLLIPIFLQAALRKGWGKHSSGETKHPIVCLIVLVHLSHLMEHPSRTLQQTRSKRYFSEFSRICDCN